MKALAITSTGIEDIAALEIKELTKSKTQIKESCIIFEPKKIEDLCLLCYKAQSIEKILFLFNNFNFTNDSFFNDLKKQIEKIDFDKWLNKKITFRVSSKKIETELSNEEICSKTGEFIINHIQKTKKYKQKVDLNNPDLIFFVYIFKNNCYLGVDMSGFDLHKRQYRIFQHPNALRATIAYSLIRIAQLKEKETILDPFTGSGTIPMEAALYFSNFPVNYYNKDKFIFLKTLKLNKNFFKSIDKKIKHSKTKIYGYDAILGYITSAKKNAKIAGIDKELKLSRCEISWLDTKFKKNSVDKIITYPPQPSKHIDQKITEKIYNEFFYQAEFILKKQGKIVLITKSSDLLKKYAEKYKFKLENKREIWHGKQLMEIVIFSKNS